MPLFHEPVFCPLGLDCESVKLTGKANGEIADIDHLLHFALAFGKNFAGLDGHEPAELLFELAQGITETANRFSANGCWHRPPFQECVVGALNRAIVISSACKADFCDGF